MSQKLVIVGGVAGGATAAARARRLDEKAEIIMFERGEHISFANCGLPYYIGGSIKDRDSLLVTTPQDMYDRYQINVRIFSEVIRIDPQEKRVEVKEIKTGKKYWETYDKLILSPGADPIQPPILKKDGYPIFFLRNVPDSDQIKTYVTEKKVHTAVVIGGGFIGVEAAENLAECGVKTTIIEKMDQVLPMLDFEMATFVHKRLKEKGVDLELANGVLDVEKADSKVVVKTEKGTSIFCDCIIASVGIRPSIDLAKNAGLSLGKTGGILVDSTMQTSNKDIFAVGDAVEVTDLVTGLSTLTALAGPANKQARIAADNAMGRKVFFKGTIGTSIVKVFDMTAASTGRNEKQLVQANIPYRVSYTHSPSNATYYPGSQMISIKLCFAPHDGRVLGAQIVGSAGVDKRIDVIATAIMAQMTVFDLEELELAYAPPYSSAKDPVNMAGFVAANILKGDTKNILWSDLIEIDSDNTVIIDLRTRPEIIIEGKIEGAINIPVDKLRNSLPELDKNKTYILYCAVGMRGYVGYRIMHQHEFKVYNLSGGYFTYLGAKDKIAQ